MEINLKFYLSEGDFILLCSEVKLQNHLAVKCNPLRE